MIEIRELGSADRDAWNMFVAAHTQSSAYHLFEWKLAIEEGYHIQTYYLAAFENGTLIGILPSGIIHPPLQKPFAVSLPFCGYAGILVQDSRDRDVVTRQFMSYLQGKRIEKVEIRELAPQMAVDTPECTLVRNLPPTSELLWADLDSNVRRKIRRATREGMTVRWGLDQLDDFYAVYSMNMARLGTPVHAKDFFRILSREAGKHVRIGTVRFEGRPVAAMYLLQFKDALLDPWVASIRKYDRWYATMLLYWEAMKAGCEQGFTQFDFGRSHRDSGTFKFKSQWGARPIPVLNHVLMSDGTSAMSTVESYRGTAAKLFSRFWRLLPYRLTLSFGPRIRRFLP